MGSAGFGEQPFRDRSRGGDGAIATGIGGSCPCRAGPTAGGRERTQAATRVIVIDRNLVEGLTFAGVALGIAGVEVQLDARADLPMRVRERVHHGGCLSPWHLEAEPVTTRTEQGLRHGQDDAAHPSRPVPTSTADTPRSGAAGAILTVELANCKYQYFIMQQVTWLR